MSDSNLLLGGTDVSDEPATESTPSKSNTNKDGVQSDNTDSSQETATETTEEPMPETDKLPPSDVLENGSLNQIKGAIATLETREDVRAYIAYENRNQKRQQILRLLDRHLDEIEPTRESSK
jgi:hypothetical protein